LRNNKSRLFNQSDFKAIHSIKTATHKLTNDVLLAARVEASSILIPLDLSTFFDTADCSILPGKNEFYSRVTWRFGDFSFSV